MPAYLQRHLQVRPRSTTTPHSYHSRSSHSWRSWLTSYWLGGWLDNVGWLNARASVVVWSGRPDYIVYMCVVIRKCSVTSVRSCDVITMTEMEWMEQRGYNHFSPLSSLHIACCEWSSGYSSGTADPHTLYMSPDPMHFITYWYRLIDYKSKWDIRLWNDCSGHAFWVMNTQCCSNWLGCDQVTNDTQYKD